MQAYLDLWLGKMEVPGTPGFDFADPTPYERVSIGRLASGLRDVVSAITSRPIVGS